MRNSPCVSVIMGVYNCESTLRESIDSLLSQTYQDFELIMCDDGSTDNTYQIAQYYASEYENVILLKNERNRGLNFTLNRCLKQARGMYIARQDGDDLSVNIRFERELQVLESDQSIALVSCPMIYFNGLGESKIGHMIEWPQKKDFVKGSPFCHAPCMIRKSVIDEVNGYSEGKTILRVEDYHLWFKIYSKGYRGYNIQEPLYKMRDDVNAYKRRKFKFRLNEVYVRFIGFKMLNLPLVYYIYTLRPLMVGILPYFIYKRLHKY